MQDYCDYYPKIIFSLVVRSERNLRLTSATLRNMPRNFNDFLIFTLQSLSNLTASILGVFYGRKFRPFLGLRVEVVFSEAFFKCVT